MVLILPPGGGVCSVLVVVPSINIMPVVVMLVFYAEFSSCAFQFFSSTLQHVLRTWKTLIRPGG